MSSTPDTTALATKAVGITEYGAADVLRPIEVEVPAPGPGQVRVAVRAAGVNPLDHKVRSGALTEVFPVTLPAVLGYEIAGVVEAVGADVTEWQPGDEVFGQVRGGGYAEYALAAADQLVRKPAGVDWTVAAALPVAAETAWRSLDLLGIEPGRTLLVHGAAGGVGTLVLQFARSRGIRVIGTASEANHPYLRELGAVPVVYGEGLAERVRAAAPEGVDRVLDLVGAGVLPLSIELAGGAEHVLTIADWSAASHGVRFTAGDEPTDYLRPALEGALALAAEGGLNLPLHRVLPLAEVAEAQRESERGHVRGKIVLTVG
ncbi:NADP-dependent oxidoreductase [Kitasatospora purpeofusca]|uniref:NADP-dependent oxidoreductase n=1 Tax=Kitasatospora purpeofusca TaxID=67352 RepID=UPI00068CD069|nr:NADP-dependent oxidoreductase [Kitasatospora purpeofusca]